MSPLVIICVGRALGQLRRCVQQDKLQTNLLLRVKRTWDDSPGVIITDVFLMIFECFLFGLRLWSEARGTETSVMSLSCNVR